MCSYPSITKWSGTAPARTSAGRPAHRDQFVPSSVLTQSPSPPTAANHAPWVVAIEPTSGLADAEVSLGLPSLVHPRRSRLAARFDGETAVAVAVPPPVRLRMIVMARAAIFGATPVGLGYEAGLPKETVASMQAVAAETVLGDQARWGLP